MPGKFLSSAAFRIVLLLMAPIFSAALGAEGLESADNRLVDERPDPTGGATLVTFGVFIFDKEFPFDTQRLPIDFVTYEHSPDEVRFAVNTEIRGDAASFSAAGWRMKIAEPEFGEFTIPAAGVVLPRLTYYIEAQPMHGITC